MGLNVSTIYAAMLAIGADMSNHESDLYVTVTPEVVGLLEGYTDGYTSFYSNIDGKLNYEFPFAYTPWWDARLKRGEK